MEQSTPDPVDSTGASRRRAGLALLDWFIPRGTCADAHELLRTRVFVALALISIGVLLSTYVALEVVGVEPIAQASITTRVAYLVGMVLPLIVLRTTRGRIVAATLFLAVTYLNLVVTTYFMGGPAAPTFSALLAVPVLAGLFGGRAHGGGWSGGVLLTWIAMVAAEATGHVFPNLVPPEHRQITRALVLLPTGANIMATVLVYETMNRRLRLELDRERALYEHLAAHDPLTELPNRRSFVAALIRAIERHQRLRRRLALLMIDLDGFKPINDRYGHPAGDQVLREVGRRLKEGLRGSDRVARIGGDEFAVIVEEVGEDPEALWIVARKAADLVREPCCLEGPSICVGASIGVAIWPDDAQEFNELLRCADSAMYAAKQHRSGVVFSKRF